MDKCRSGHTGKCLQFLLETLPWESPMELAGDLGLTSYPKVGSLTPTGATSILHCTARCRYVVGVWLGPMKVMRLSSINGHSRLQGYLESRRKDGKMYLPLSLVKSGISQAETKPFECEWKKKSSMKAT